MLKVALTGGMAAGKSAALGRFAQLGAKTTDADQLAREVVEPGSEGLAAIVRRFGTGVLQADGSLNRPALGAVVFADAGARLDLEAIVHPLIQQRSSQVEAEAELEGVAVVVHDIPLLAEGGRASEFDQVVVVQAPLELRRQRALTERGMTSEQFDARIAAQATDAERAALATHLLDHSGSVEELWAQVDRLYQSWTGLA